MATYRLDAAPIVTVQKASYTTEENIILGVRYRVYRSNLLGAGPVWWSKIHVYTANGTKIAEKNVTHPGTTTSPTVEPGGGGDVTIPAGSLPAGNHTLVVQITAGG